MAGMRQRGDHADGWAILPFRGRPHWFQFDVDGDKMTVETLCGLRYNGPAMAQVGEPGNFPRCKRCIAALRRRA